MERHAVLEKGEIYRNRGGGAYMCNDIVPDGAIMTNIESGWRCTVHNITRFDNGTIEWDYSTNGHFE